MYKPILYDVIIQKYLINIKIIRKIYKLLVNKYKHRLILRLIKIIASVWTNQHQIVYEL
jgi:hypothetical protein